MWSASGNMARDGGSNTHTLLYTAIPVRNRIMHCTPSVGRSVRQSLTDQ